MRRYRVAWLAAVMAAMPVASIAQTAGGFEIGPELYYYAYREPNLVALTGPFAGVNGSYTATVDGWFAAVNLIGDIGYLDYTSNGTGRISGIFNFTGDLRGLIGHDIRLAETVFASPYLGLGYRLLLDKAGGRTSTTGAVGYDRLSQYFYLPLGVGFSFASGRWVFRPSAEFDWLIRGVQISYFSQAGFDNDATNIQRHGYGVRITFLAETTWSQTRLAFGPFFRYWNIKDSDLSTLSFAGVPIAEVFEPANNTVEAGVTLRFRF